MTNEEAISVIENEIQIDVRLCTGEQVDRFQTALYMAISALRAEPTGDSLTLEQLRKMDGRPVWVKVIGKTGIRCDGWCEAEIREKDPFAYVWWPGSEVEDIAKIEDYGKTWACYAYPPAHIDREAWEPCEFCGKADFGEYGFEIGRSYVKIACAIGSWRFQTEEQFHFCPECGRPLKEDAWAELEKRMGV